MTSDRHPGRDEEAAAAASSEIFRLVIVSGVAIMLLAGGVYWLRQWPQRPGGLEPGPTVQVVIVETKDPTPIEAPPPEHQAVVAAGSVGRSTESDPSWSEGDAQVSEVSVQHDPPAPAVIAPPRPVSVASRTEAALKFRHELLQHIARFEQYPVRAKSKGVEGTVQVLFRLRRDGRVLDAQVMRSSGETDLDVEAIATLYRAEPLPSIPGEMPDELRVLLPIAFSLR